MRSLAGIRARLDELLSASAVDNERPSCVILLPENYRGPEYAGPWPYVQRMGRCAMIHYLPESGQPSDEEIRKLVNGTVAA
jgi:hypothetical protein